MDNLGNIEQVVPATETIQFAGKQIEIKPFSIGQIAKVAKHIAKLLRHVKFETDNLLENSIELLENADNGLFDVVMMATSTSRPVVEDQDPETFLQAVFAIYKVNKDFFDRKLLPLIQATFPNQSTGSESSSTSSPGATVTAA